MFKQTVQYRNFDDKLSTRVLYFNLTETEILDHMELVPELERIQAFLEGPERELTQDEIQQILNLVKKTIHISYGVRSDDGEEFEKSPEILQKFQASAVYNAFLLSLFKEPEKAFSFIVAVMPKELVESAEKEMRARGELIETVQSPLLAAVPVEDTAPDEYDPEKDWHDFSQSDLESMPQTNFDHYYQKVVGPKPGILVSIAMKRKARG